MTDARSQQSPPLAAAAAAAVLLLGYLAGRTAYERAGSWLAGGAGTGATLVALAPLYLGTVAAAAWAAARLAPSLHPVWATLRISAPTARLAGLGLAGAALLVAAVYAADAAGGWVAVSRSGPGARWLLPLAAYCVLYAVIAVNEEVVFRGGLLHLLGGVGGRAWGVLGSSLLFAAVHLGGATTWQRLAGLFLLGVLLAQAYLASRSLWLPIAIHWGVHVLGLAAVLGLPPARVAFTGPASLTGTPDALDGGWVMIAALALAVAIAALARRPGPARRSRPTF